jgi:hypothetical protein
MTTEDSSTKSKLLRISSILIMSSLLFSVVSISNSFALSIDIWKTVDVADANSTSGLAITPPPDIITTATGVTTPIALGRPLLNVPPNVSVTVTNDAPQVGSIPTGALGYWSFDNGGYDGSGNGNYATINGASLINGKVGSALSFSGNNTVRVADTIPLQLNSAFSISVWVSFSNLNPQSEYLQIIQKVDSSDDRYQLVYDKVSKTISFGFKQNGSYHNVSSNTTNWEIGKWYHIVGVYDPLGGHNNNKIFVNGLLDNAQTNTGIPSVTDGDLMIGGTSAIGISNWQGGIDEVRIYSRALTTSEVSQLYLSPFLSLPQGTSIITWTAKDSTGATAIAKQVISLDTTNTNYPTSTLSMSDPKYSDSKYTFVTSDTLFTISSTAGASTYFRYYWNQNSGAKPDFANGASFHIYADDAKYTVEFYSVGSNGLSGPLRSQTIVLDNSYAKSAKIAPNFIAGTSGFTLFATDNPGGSNLGKSSTSGIYYKFDSNPTYTFVKSGSTNFFLSGMGAGTHTVTYYSLDDVGNKEPQNVATFSFYNSCQQLPLSQLKGVNLLDPVLTSRHSGPLFAASINYARDSLLKLREYGFNVVRVPYAWEAYEYNSTAFLSEAKSVAYYAERTGICVIFDFHHWFHSSYFKDGAVGFPYFLLGKYKQGGAEDEAKVFFSDFLNNTVSYNGISAWDLQAQFMNKVIAQVDKYTSVLGYEIINEPTLYDYSQYQKIGNYHTYIAQKIRPNTGKYIFFTAERTVGVNRDHVLDQLIVPRGASKIAFAPHIYSTLSAGSGAEWQMKKWKENAQKWGGIPIFIAEWANDSTASMKTNIDYFSSSKQGWCYWAYTPYDLNKSYYQLIDSNSQPTTYLTDLLGDMKP